MYEHSLLETLDDLYRRNSVLFESLPITSEYNDILLTHSLRDILHSTNGLERFFEEIYPHDGSGTVRAVVDNTFAPMVAYVIGVVELQARTLDTSVDLGWMMWENDHRPTTDQVLYYHFLYAYRRSVFGHPPIEAVKK